MTDNSIDLKFGDGEYTFALPLPQISELQRKCDIGIGGLFARVLKGATLVRGEVVLDPHQAQFYALDVIETIRLGLIGGGKGVVNGEEVKVTPVLATKLVDAYLLGHPLKDGWNMAAAVLGACILGFEPPKKDQPGEDRAPETDNETTDTSTTV